jgi:hypothetical protein
MKINEYGSIDPYIGPEVPKGYESNWIPTAGKVPFLLFRFYGPTEALFNKTFMLTSSVLSCGLLCVLGGLSERRERARDRKPITITIAIHIP